MFVLLQARGGTSRGLRRKSVRMPAAQASSAGSREERPSKRARHSAGTEEEPLVVDSDETEEPTDADLEDTSGETVPRATSSQAEVSSQAVEEGSEEDEEGSEEEDEEEDDEDEG
jgi:hypothetical protein